MLALTVFFPACLALVSACASEVHENTDSAPAPWQCDSAGAAPCPDGMFCSDEGVCTELEDCAGVPGGLAVEDNCGVCDADSSNDCVEDCMGVFGGSASVDECGICNEFAEDNCVQDCNGSWGGEAILDQCGVCDEDPNNDCVQDCFGVWGGDAAVDHCGVCEGDASTCAMWYLGEGGESCHEVCSNLGLSCVEADLVALDTNGLVWDVFAAALGAECNHRGTNCMDGEENYCAQWGAPFLHKDYVESRSCQGGIPAADCSVAFSMNHHRVCPCS